MILKKYKYIYALSIVFFASINTIQAQNTWTLLNCIDYAIENNIDLNTCYNQVQLQETILFERIAKI